MSSYEYLRYLSGDFSTNVIITLLETNRYDIYIRLTTVLNITIIGISEIGVTVTCIYCDNHYGLYWIYTGNISIYQVFLINLAFFVFV